MRTKKQQKRRFDRRVVVGLLALANAIIVVGLVWTYSLLSVVFTFIGIAGLFAIALTILWGLCFVACCKCGD